MRSKEKRYLEFPVLKVSQPIGDFYIASIDAEDLVDISYRDVRRLAKDQRDVEKYLGIQRPIKPQRIKEIKKYIEGNDATFPTSVILAVDEKCAEFKDNEDGTGVLMLHEYETEDPENEESIPFDKVAKVIDGQHRIAAFMDENDNWNFEFDDRKFFINVSIFIGADISEQANIFATVNLAQTKVNKNLVYDLTELSNHPSPHKTCHNVSVMLDRETSSPFYERIKRLGTATPGRVHEPLTQAAFVEELVRFISTDPVDDRNKLLAGKSIPKANEKELTKTPFRNLFLRGAETDIAEILYNYFGAVRRKWPNSWASIDRKGNLLPRSNAFKALMKYLRYDVYLDLVGDEIGRIPTEDEFFPYFDRIECRDDDFTTRNFSPGSGGQSAFLKLLRGQVKISDLENF